MFDLEAELKKLPDKPGVYLMHDKEDHIIYVGKAVVLKNRVRQYFQKSRNVSPKIARMIEQIAWFEYIVTDSELEALVLECNLIKEHNPFFESYDSGRFSAVCPGQADETGWRQIFWPLHQRSGDPGYH